MVQRVGHFPECPGFRRGWRIDDRQMAGRLTFLFVKAGKLAGGLEDMPKDRLHFGAKDYSRRDCRRQGFGKPCIEAGA